MLVLIVLDLHDIEGSFNHDLLKAMIERQADIQLVINKMDTFPECSKIVQFKEKLVKLLNEISLKIPNLVF